MKIPRVYQLAAAHRASKRNLLLTDECGLGKTITAITAAQQAGAKKILVVCPLRVRPQWNIEVHGQVSDGTVIQNLQYGIPIKLYETNGLLPEGWFFTYYEAAREDATLSNYLWDFMIIDEAHRIKNRTTKWTKELKHIPAVRKMALTGTPMEKTPADLWSILNWLYPGTYRSYWKFYEKYVDYTEEGWKQKYRVIVGPKNTDKLAKELATVMLRRTKKEVEPELPPRIEKDVFVPMSKRQREAYKRVKESKDILLEYEGTEMFIPNALALFGKLHQMSVLPTALGIAAGSPKIDWLMEWLDDNPDPVVIFSRYRAVVQLVHHAIDSDIIVGGVKDLPHRFLNGEVRAVVGTISAMGEGLNLQKAEVAIFLDQEWSTTKMTQAIDRIHRIGIDSPRLIYYLHSSKADAHVLESIRKKWTDAEMIYEAVKSNVL